VSLTRISFIVYIDPMEIYAASSSYLFRYIQ